MRTPCYTHLLLFVSCSHPTGKGGYHQLEQVKLWKGFLEYERSNPQRLDATALTQRVELAYMQALMCLLHFPEVRRASSACAHTHAHAHRAKTTLRHACAHASMLSRHVRVGLHANSRVLFALP